MQPELSPDIDRPGNRAGSNRKPILKYHRCAYLCGAASADKLSFGGQGDGEPNRVISRLGVPGEELRAERSI
jgi:hypothetical protein